jgi:hypothetical protein
VSGKERRVKFGREKKNGKRNDPGKAQVYIRLWSGSKLLLSFRSGSGQARVIFQARSAAGATASCGIIFYGKVWRERWNRESGGV